MALALDIQPLLDLLARPVGSNGDITVGIIIMIILLFYILAKEGGK